MAQMPSSKFRLVVLHDTSPEMVRAHLGGLCYMRGPLFDTSPIQQVQRKRNRWGGGRALPKRRAAAAWAAGAPSQCGVTSNR